MMAKQTVEAIQAQTQLHEVKVFNVPAGTTLSDYEKRKSKLEKIDAGSHGNTRH